MASAVRFHLISPVVDMSVSCQYPAIWLYSAAGKPVGVQSNTVVPKEIWPLVFTKNSLYEAPYKSKDQESSKLMSSGAEAASTFQLAPPTLVPSTSHAISLGPNPPIPGGGTMVKYVSSGSTQHWQSSEDAIFLTRTSLSRARSSSKLSRCSCKKVR